MKLTEKTYNYVLFVSLTIIFIILELVAMKLSYENYGWFEMCVIFIAIFINILPILFFIFNKKSVAIIILRRSKYCLLRISIKTQHW